MIRSQIKATKLYSNKYTEHQVQIMEEQLKAVQNDIQLTKAISVPVQTLGTYNAREVTAMPFIQAVPCGSCSGQAGIA